MTLPPAAPSLAARDLLPVFNALPGANLLLDPDLRIVGASDDYLGATLTQRASLVGQFIFDAFPDNPQAPEANAVANVRASLMQVLATRQPHIMAPQHYDVPDPAQPGRFVERHWQPRHTPVLDEVGQVQFIIQSVQDITARRLAEQQLRESQARERAAWAEAEQQRSELQRLFEQAPVAMALFRGPDYVIELANEPMAVIWGRTLAQTLGQRIFTALPDLRNQGFEALFADVLTQGAAYNLPEVAVTIDRAHTGQPTLGYFNLTYRPQRDSQGQLTGIFTIAQEVTEQVVARQRVEQLNQELEARVQARTRQLSEQQVLLRQILGQVPAYIATLSGPEHRYTFFNESYQALAAERTALGLTVADVFPEVVDQGFLGLLDQVYATGEAFIGLSTPAQLLDRATGQPVQHYIDFIYQPLFDDQQRVQGILAFILDVTDRVLAQQRAEQSQQQVRALNAQLAALNEELHATNVDLSRSNARLLRTNVDLDTFVYTASHDLKAPITNIEGILAALRETLPLAVRQGPVVAHLLGLLDHTVGRFLTTITDLTDLARLQQTYDEPAELLALAPVVAGVVADLGPAIAAAGAALHLDVPAEVLVSFAPASLRSIVYNLLSNAVKYRDFERPAQVWLQADAQPGAVVLRVRDNGLGLNEVQQQRLFGVFQRLHTHVAGTGVGLYMIKRLIDNAGARITVSSEAGVGSTFTVTFPA